MPARRERSFCLISCPKTLPYSPVKAIFGSASIVGPRAGSVFFCLISWAKHLPYSPVKAIFGSASIMCPRAGSVFLLNILSEAPSLFAS